MLFYKIILMSDLNKNNTNIPKKRGRPKNSEKKNLKENNEVKVLKRRGRKPKEKQNNNEESQEPIKIPKKEDENLKNHRLLKIKKKIFLVTNKLYYIYP